MLKKITTKNENGKKFHLVNSMYIECSGQDCELCYSETQLKFEEWLSSIPFPMPPKNKRYKNELAQKHRGKTILEICSKCKPIPCYLCKRKECSEWGKDQSLRGQERACSAWEKGKCNNFACELGIIKTNWK